MRSKPRIAHRLGRVATHTRAPRTCGTPTLSASTQRASGCRERRGLRRSSTAAGIANGMGRASPCRHAALLARLLGAELVSTLRLAPGALPGRSPQFPLELVRRASLPELHRFPPHEGRVCPGVHQQELKGCRWRWARGCPWRRLQPRSCGRRGTCSCAQSHASWCWDSSLDGSFKLRWPWQNADKACQR